MYSPRISKTRLGPTDLKVSVMGFGTIPFGGKSWKKAPSIPPVRGGKVLTKALELGINYWDTAEGYNTHPHVREALAQVRRSDVVISTKSTRKSLDGVRARVERSLAELDTSYIDLYFLHAVDSVPDLRERCSGALRAMEEARNEGLIRFIGLSTHQAKVVNAAADVEDIDVILAPVNKTGHMPSDNSRDEMVSAIEKAYDAGKGMALMKILAYGDVTLEEGLEFSLSVPAHTTLIGMRNLKELEEDVEIFHRVWNQSR